MCGPSELWAGLSSLTNKNLGLPIQFSFQTSSTKFQSKYIPAILRPVLRPRDCTRCLAQMQTELSLLYMIWQPRHWLLPWCFPSCNDNKDAVYGMWPKAVLSISHMLSFALLAKPRGLWLSPLFYSWGNRLREMKELSGAHKTQVAQVEAEPEGAAEMVKAWKTSWGQRLLFEEANS